MLRNTASTAASSTLDPELCTTWIDVTWPSAAMTMRTLTLPPLSLWDASLGWEECWSYQYVNRSIQGAPLFAPLALLALFAPPAMLPPLLLGVIDSPTSASAGTGAGRAAGRCSGAGRGVDARLVERMA